MLTDMEGNKIKLAEEPNGHLLILGRSGMGKTYFACRKIEEDYRKGKSILILDYSGSYTRKEMSKNNFVFQNKIDEQNPDETVINWKLYVSNYLDVIAESLLRALKSESYYQTKLLRESDQILLDNGRNLNIGKLLTVMEDLLKKKETEDEWKNLLHLLTRLEPFSGIDKLNIMPQDKESIPDKSARITILQLSGFAEKQRKFLMKFLADLIWQECRGGKKQFDVILFDEFQYMDLSTDSPLASFLREGRKFGVSIYLSSQFIGKADDEQAETLMQAGNMLFFSRRKQR